MSLPIEYEKWTATAKIDYITIRFPKRLNTWRDVKALSWVGKGFIQNPKKLGKSNPHGCDWLTIHDPDRIALQFLIDSFPETEILALEVAIDFRLRDGTKSPARLREAYDWLKIGLFPQQHPTMSEAKRKYFDRNDRKIKRDNLKARPHKQTVYWQDKTYWEQVRLYIKTKDAHIPHVEHSVRVEATLHRGGCQLAEVTRLKTLPAFARNLRKYLSPFYQIIQGIKPKIKRTRATDPVKLKAATHAAEKEQRRVERSWVKYGASWAVKHGYRTMPDKQANRMTGAALNELRRDLLKLSAP